MALLLCTFQAGCTVFTNFNFASSLPIFLCSVQVISHGKAWTVRRTFREFCFLDRQCHTCVFDRAFSKLPHLADKDDNKVDLEVEEQENLGPNAVNNGQNCQVRPRITLECIFLYMRLCEPAV